MGPNNKWLTYKDAKHIISSKKLKHLSAYKQWFTEAGIANKKWNGKKLHGTPDKHYQDKWISWDHYLSYKPIDRFMPFNEARKFARALNLRTYIDWLDYCETGARPKNIPSNPYVTYSKQFKGWPDFLGKKKKSI